MSNGAIGGNHSLSLVISFYQYACFPCFSFEQAALLAMVLVGVRNEPQGPAYLPPSPRAGGGGTGHPDDWAGVSMYCIYL